MTLKASGKVIAMAEKNWKVGRRGREGPAGAKEEFSRTELPA